MISSHQIRLYLICFHLGKQLKRKRMIVIFHANLFNQRQQKKMIFKSNALRKTMVGSFAPL